MSKLKILFSIFLFFLIAYCFFLCVMATFDYLESLSSLNITLSFATKVFASAFFLLVAILVVLMVAILIAIVLSL